MWEQPDVSGPKVHPSLPDHYPLLSHWQQWTSLLWKWGKLPCASYCTCMLVALYAMRKGLSRRSLGMMAVACYVPMGHAPCKFTKLGYHSKTANKLIHLSGLPCYGKLQQMHALGVAILCPHNLLILATTLKLTLI